MRKQTKLVAVLSAAALLAMGASMTSFAAGWEKADDGTWLFYDKNDELVEDEWRKDGGKWFYLGEDGEMAVDQWVDDEYYVGEDGAMLRNQWKKTIADESVNDPEDEGEHWYYFGSTGKKVTEDSKKINGKTYYFDDDGKMEYGWFANSAGIYYLGEEDDGARRDNQWVWLEKPGNFEDDNEQDEAANALNCSDDDKCDDEGWYWFGTGGKMYNEANKKRINGKYYYFNNHGQMLYEWINNNQYVVSDPVTKPTTKTNKVASGANANRLDGEVAPASRANAKIWNMIYANTVEDGSRTDGWYEIAGSEDAGTGTDTDWYFFDGGKVTRADSASDLAAYDEDGKVYVTRKKADSAKGKKYFAFNEMGQMQTGLQYIAKDHGFYYFNDNGYMTTGKVVGVECDDNDHDFYFETKNGHNGEGYTGEKNGYLYFYGKKLVADDDFRLFIVGNDVYLVNSKGRIQKTKTREYYIENEGINCDDVIVTIGSGNKVTEIKVPTAAGASTYTTYKASEIIADAATRFQPVDGKYDDNLASVPFIELYDNNVFTYDTLDSDADGTVDSFKKAAEWYDVHDGTTAPAKGFSVNGQR